MNDSAEELASTWLTQRAERLTRLSASHRFAIDLAICLATAALSIGGLATQHRLDTIAVIFCAGLCGPLLLRRLSPFLCFGVIAFVALAQWLLAGPQLADAAVLLALYWVALDGSLIEGALAGATVELGAVMASLRWAPTAPLKVWVGLTGLATAAGVLGVSIRQRRALVASLHEKAARLEFERDQEPRSLDLDLALSSVPLSACLKELERCSPSDVELVKGVSVVLVSVDERSVLS